MAHAVYVRLQQFYKIYVDDEEAEGKTEEEIEQIAREKLTEKGPAILAEDDTPFEPEVDILELWYGYDF